MIKLVDKIETTNMEFDEILSRGCIPNGYLLMAVYEGKYKNYGVIVINDPNINKYSIVDNTGKLIFREKTLYEIFQEPRLTNFMLVPPKEVSEYFVKFIDGLNYP